MSVFGWFGLELSWCEAKVWRTGDVLDGYGTTKTRCNSANNVSRTASRHWRGSPFNTRQRRKHWNADLKEETEKTQARNDTRGRSDGLNSNITDHL